MEYQRYVQAVEEASRLTEAGEYAKALTIFEALLAGDLSDIDKGILCLNMAVVLEKMDRPDQALSWYDRGIAFEQRHSRFFVTEQKAVFLARIGRNSESLRIYEDLLTRRYLAESDKERVRSNIVGLKERRE